MRYPVNDYKQKWYNAQGYGAKTDYGYHEGDDLNLKTGGDTDLGQPLYAIADGEVTSVHNHTSIPTFGNHLHIKHDGPWGTVYSHYAHCQSIGVKVGDRVSEGQEIAKLGKSGTTAAHCHFAIKLMPTGIDAIAHTLEDLEKWTSPIAFIERYINQSPGGQDNMSDDEIVIKKATFEELVTKSSKYDEFIKAGYDNAQQMLSKFQELNDQVKGASEDKKNAENQAEAYRKQLNEFVAELAQALDTRQDIPEIIAEAQKCGSVAGQLEDLTTRYTKEKTAWGITESDLNAEIKRLQSMLDYEDVLSNAKLEELITAIIKKLKAILRK